MPARRERGLALLLASMLGCGGNDGLPRASTPDPNPAIDPARIAPHQPPPHQPPPPPIPVPK